MDSRRKKIKLELTPKPRTTILDLKEVFPNIAEDLTLRELFAFRCASKSCRELVDAFLEAMEVLEIGTRSHNTCLEVHFQVILQKCCRLRKIDIECSWPAWLTDDLSAELIRNNPLLEMFTMRCCKITTKGLEPLAKCKKLVVLNLPQMDLQDDFLYLMAKNHKNLLELTFEVNYHLTGKAIAALVAKQPKLRYISLPGEADADPIAKAIIKNCPDFLCINFPEYHMEPDQPLRKMAKLCPKLQVICISEMARYYHDVMRYIESKGVKFTQGYVNDDDYEFYSLE